jgi:hypothetical protein
MAGRVGCLPPSAAALRSNLFKEPENNRPPVPHAEPGGLGGLIMASRRQLLLAAGTLEAL